MAYRGENIDIAVKGDTQHDLDSKDFKVLVYPDGHTENVQIISKSQMQKIETNYYSGTISYETSKTMPLGSYTIEVLVIEGQNDRSIFLSRSAFPLYDSASSAIV